MVKTLNLWSRGLSFPWGGEPPEAFAVSLRLLCHMSNYEIIPVYTGETFVRALAIHLPCRHGGVESFKSHMMWFTSQTCRPSLCLSRHNVDRESKRVADGLTSQEGFPASIS